MVAGCRWMSSHLALWLWRICFPSTTSNHGLCTLNQGRHVGLSAWLWVWQNSRKSTCSSDVTQATPPKVSVPSITRDAAGIELTHLGIGLVVVDVPRPRVRPQAFSENAFMSRLQAALLLFRSIFHTSRPYLSDRRTLKNPRILRVPPY